MKMASHRRWFGRLLRALIMSLVIVVASCQGDSIGDLGENADVLSWEVSMVKFMVRENWLLTLLRQRKAVAVTITTAVRTSKERKITIANEFEF